MTDNYCNTCVHYCDAELTVHKKEYFACGIAGVCLEPTYKLRGVPHVNNPSTTYCGKWEQLEGHWSMVWPEDSKQ